MSGVIKRDEPMVFTPPLTNLHTAAKVDVTYDKDLFICVQEEHELPHWTQYNYDTCTLFYKLYVGSEFEAPNGTLPSKPTGNTTVTLYFPLRTFRYFVGIYFPVQVITQTFNATVHLSMTGDSCSSEQFWNGEACVAPQPLKLNSNLTSVLKKGVNLLSLDLPTLTGHFSIRVPGLTSTSQIWLRWEATPSSYYADASVTGSGPVSFSSPRPGRWIIAVFNSAADETKTIFATGQVCMTPYLAGPTCTTPISLASNNMNEVVQPGEYKYFKFEATPATSLYISITTPNQKNLPKMFASRGQLPTFGNADVSNCNQKWCQVVKTIKVDASSPEPWFIGITADPLAGDNKNVTFGIWFNSTCVPGCEINGRGTCMDSGLCECWIDYSGIDCGHFKGTGAQFKVLGIVSAVVLVLAAIPLATWLYSRQREKKRTAGYEVI
eukprot:TRINITY_DN14220_c0_g1_i1.p1 TRINITY_DN14220_c0_g1~~TRINITY_DN14220_c0_g1_i1.p1  ORF type:complete len:467 (-),score=64.96 TRINITY_DN14220_c0_g1_i1:81-1391(-)